ncbi:unnamed protein product [Rotaria sordida]|uniref:Uncharacterized protein n=2 Tax=Rotaria sordida TaxID=392033 RepID=A0A818M1J7_9BILA|nr:unnamed protein product [Rotaria sordida]
MSDSTTEIKSDDINSNPSSIHDDQPKHESIDKHMDNVSEKHYSNEISIPNEYVIIDHSHDNYPHDSHPHDDHPHDNHFHDNQPHDTHPHDNHLHDNQPHDNPLHDNPLHGNQPHDNQPHDTHPHDNQPHVNQPHDIHPHDNYPHDNHLHDNYPHDNPLHDNSLHDNQPRDNPLHDNPLHDNPLHDNQPHDNQLRDNQPHDNQPHDTHPHDNYPCDNPLHDNQPHDNSLHDNQPHDDHSHDNQPHDNHSHDNQPHDTHPHGNHPHDNQPHDIHPHGNHPHDNPLHDIHPNDNHLDDNNDLSNDAQEKQLEEELDDIDALQQIQADISDPPGAAEMTQHTSVRSKQLISLSKIPFFRQSKEPKKPKARRLKMHEIFRFADKWDILLMIIGAIAAIAAGGLFPVMLYLYRGVINNLVDIGKIQTNVTAVNDIIRQSSECFVVPNKAANTESIHEAILKIIRYYVIIGFSSILCYWIAWSTWLLAAERQVRRIRYALFRNILRQEIGWFDVHNAGELSNRLIDDLDKIKDGINDQVPDFISLLSRMLGAVIYSLATGWKLTLVFLSISPLIIITFNVTVLVIVKFTIKEIKAFAVASSIAQEVIQNIRTVTAFHGQAKEEERFVTNLNVAKKIGIKKGIYIGISQCLSQIFTFMAFTVTLWYGPKLMRTECMTYTGGTVLVVFVACMVATTSTAQFIPNFQNFAEALGSGSYVFETLDRQTKIDAMNDEGDKPQQIIGDIEFDNVTFTYPARQETSVLNNLSLKISSGKTVALVGASGCGKSTIIQLIQRFYDPDQGRVLLDGKDIKTLNVAWLRSHIGIVSQEPVLFTGSIEDNIRFGKQDATDEEVQAAAKMANAHDFIMILPENYKATSADKLSGGQKQRVAIARALVSNPRILLLDEATSALDNASERVVQDALDKAKMGRTTIVIAHRLSTIRNADLIIALDKGEVIEYGTHNVLMDRKGLYYELVIAQQRKEKKEEEESSDEDNPIELLDKKELMRRRTLSFGSVHSEHSDVPDLDTMNDTTVEIKKKRFFRKPFIFKILKLNYPELNWIILGCITSITFGTITPLFALLFSEIYGLFAEPDIDKANTQTRNYAIIIFFIGVAGGICQCLSSIAFSKSGEALTMRMRIISFASMLRQEIAWFDREENSLGALVTQLSSDASNLKGLSGIRMGIIFNAVGAVICALTIAFQAGWKLTFIVLLFVPLMFFSGILQARRMNNTKKTKEKKSGNLSWEEKGGTFATEAIDSIRTVVGLHQEEYFISHYEDCFNNEFKRSLIKIQLQSFGTGLANSIMFFIHAAAFGYGSVLVENGEMEAVRVFRVFSVITFGAMTVGRSTAMIPDYAKGKDSAIRILNLNNRRSNIDPNDTNGIVLDKVQGNIQFDGVKFVYPTRPKLRILKDFNLLINASQTTALCGPSGSGKSTCVALLLRFYDPYDGIVLLDGHDIRELSLPWLRSQLGFVQQEPVLFNLSVRDNIAYGDNGRKVSQEEIEQAARKANIHDSIILFPQGYDTMCGAKGAQISGGQKQRIAIARALIRNPKILLLDEATSALDIHSERIVQEALDVARSGRTCLTIAHRLATIRNSDRIVVVDRGRIKESGTHDELMEHRGIYHKLNMAQERNDDE